MNHTLHCRLRKSFSWYHRWHSHPRHQHAHWLFFVSVALLFTTFISGEVLNLNLSNYSAHAQASNVQYYGHYVVEDDGRNVRLVDEVNSFTNIIHFRYDSGGMNRLASDNVGRIQDAGMKVMLEVPFNESQFSNASVRETHLQSVKADIDSYNFMSSIVYFSIFEEWYTLIDQGFYDSWAIFQGKSRDQQFAIAKQYLEQIINDVHRIFPGIPTVIVENVARNRLPGPPPPSNLDVIGVDAYYIPDNASCDSTQKAKFDSEVIPWYDAAKQYGKPIMMVPPSFISGPWKMLSECQMQWYADLALSGNYNIQSFIWFVYGDLDGLVGVRSFSNLVAYQKTLGCTFLGGSYCGTTQPPPPPPPGTPPGPLPPPGTPPGPGAQSVESCDPAMMVEGYMVACDVYPYTIAPGQAAQISGFNLGTTVDLLSDTGTIVSTTGSLNPDGTILTFTVPSNTPEGAYNISISGTVNIIINGEVVTGQTQQTSPSQKLTVTLNPTLTNEYNYEGGVLIYYPPPPKFKVALPLPPLPDATDFQELISFVFTYSIYLVGIAVFIMILYGGFLWLTSAANPGNIALAKSYITNAIIGAVLLISSYAILYTINPELVGGGFTLEGIKAPTPVSSEGVNRLYATSEVGAASAITSGCTIAVELGNLTAIECPTLVADGLGLPFDPIMQTLDTNANTQVNATVLQNSGNLGAGIKIVVLDTGYNRDHPELSSSYGGGWDFVNKDNDPTDDHTSGTGSPGHGSHVAGIITADGVDSRARGVASEAQIIAGKTLDSRGQGYWSSMIEAIYWAINGPDRIYGTSDDINPDIINISMGGGSYGGICDNNDSTTQLLLRALQYARDHGALPIVAAGNSSGGVSLPGCLSAAFTVGAVDSSDRIANFSGRGPSVDIVAPGIDIYSSLLASNYGTKRGTSMATPVVSGVAALIKSANSSYTVSQLEEAITNTACDLGQTGKDTVYGWGRISAVSGSCTASPIPSISITGEISMSPPSCTKGVVAGNPNCDTNVNYSIRGVTTPTTITVRRNGASFQSFTCGSNPCTGQINFDNPTAGVHLFALYLPNGSLITRTSAYIYTVGSITSNPGSSCTKNTGSNPNCNITLTINAPGVYPAQLLIKKDGNNWRLLPCSTSACNETVIDLNPTPGIHTYALYNTSDNSRLSRATVYIANGTSTAPAPPGPVPPAGPAPILEICWPGELPTATTSCDPGLSLTVGQSVQLRAWYDPDGDRLNWQDYTNFASWQGCNNSGSPCDDTWFSAPGLFNGLSAGASWVNANFSGTSDQSTITVNP